MSAKWRKFSLGELTNWSSGGTPSKKNTEFWTGSIPWISASSMRSTRYSESELKITSEGLKSGSRLAPMGSILLLVRGSILHQKIPVGIATRDVAFNQDVKAIQVKKHLVDDEVVDNWYLFYWLKANEKLLLSIVENTGIGAGKLDTKQLQELEIDVPSWDEQQQIVACCKAIEEKEIINAQINQTLEQMAQAIFKSWFIDFDPVKAKIAALEAGGSEDDALLAAMQTIAGSALFTTDAADADAQTQLARLQTEHPEQYATLRATAELFPSAMQESELGEIPEGWDALPLYETAEYVNGAAFKATDFSEDRSGLPIVKIAELKQGVSATTQFTNGTFRERYQIESGDVLYSWSGSPETSLEVFRWFGGKGWLNQHIFKLNFHETHNKHFAFFLLRQIKPLLIRTAQQKQTTGLGHITVADMKRIKIPYPDQRLVSRFSEAVGPIYDRGSEAIQESDLLAQLRDSLLPKLLSGELSLAATEEQLADTVEPAHV